MRSSTSCGNSSASADSLGAPFFRARYSVRVSKIKGLSRRSEKRIRRGKEFRVSSVVRVDDDAFVCGVAEVPPLPLPQPLARGPLRLR